MKTSTIKQQVALMLGAVIILLTMLCLLFLDTIYLTSSVRIVFIIGAVVGGLCLMQGMTNKTTVEIEHKSILPTNKLRQQQLKVHERNINSLDLLVDDASRLRLLVKRPDDVESLNRINVYLLEMLGREQEMIQALQSNNNYKVKIGDKTYENRHSNVDYNELEAKDKETRGL